MSAGSPTVRLSATAPSGPTGLQRRGTAATRTANTWRRLLRWAGFDGTDSPVGKYFSRVRFAERIACCPF